MQGEDKGVSIEDQKSILQIYLIAVGSFAILSQVVMLFFKYKEREDEDGGDG